MIRYQEAGYDDMYIQYMGEGYWYLIKKLTSPSLISSLSNVATVAVLFIAHPVKAL